jgi:hypothetical protein
MRKLIPMLLSYVYLILLCCLLLAPTAVAAQQQSSSVPEYGTLADIKHTRKVYVYSEDLKSRELILKELNKDSLLQVVGKPEEAEFFIFYGSSFFDTGYSSFGVFGGSIFGSVISRNTAEIGEYYVLMRGDKLENGVYRPRILWGKQNLHVARNSPASVFIKESARLPAAGVTKKFVKELQRTRKN